jgi:hypothetical protein
VFSIRTKFLNIKSQVNAVFKQKIEFKADRLGFVLLGNLARGKPTVARIYAKFLTAMGSIPSSLNIETTGSRLANDRVLSINEAYQLAQSNGPGSQVLDFILHILITWQEQIQVNNSKFSKALHKRGIFNLIEAMIIAR